MGSKLAMREKGASGVRGEEWEGRDGMGWEGKLIMECKETEFCLSQYVNRDDVFTVEML